MTCAEPGCGRMDRTLVLIIIVIVSQPFERLVFPHALGDVAAKRIAGAERHAHLFPNVFAQIP